MAIDYIEAFNVKGPIRDDCYDVYEAGHADIYSCIAICRRNWTDDFPALGGTRWVVAEGAMTELAKASARDTAIELAMAMYKKNSILRKAERALGRAVGQSLFNWQGGKGVILSPSGAPLTPARLIWHGRLVEHLQGTYIGSKDAGVATPELKWIATATGFTIGLGCGRDTGEATAEGVCAGLKTAVKRLAPQFNTDSLKGVHILVLGLGKVGYPLIELLHVAGAVVYVYDPQLMPEDLSVNRWCEIFEDPEADPDQRQRRRDALTAISKAGQVLRSEGEALSRPELQVISPNGGPIRWLARRIAGRSCAEILAQNRARNGRLVLVMGAGNDQVSTTDAGRAEREAVLSTLTEAGVLFFPDPLVSPGGVIAVSHELAARWDAAKVNRDAREIVEESVEQTLMQAASYGTVSSTSVYRAFEKLTDEEWIPRSGERFNALALNSAAIESHVTG